MLALSANDLGLLIDLACCYTCSSNTNRFNVRLTDGHQLDCKAKTVTNLTDTCNDNRQAIALLNCWAAAVSSASTASFGFAALLVAVLFF
jgi:hypothetical protein